MNASLPFVNDRTSPAVSDGSAQPPGAEILPLVAQPQRKRGRWQRLRTRLASRRLDDEGAVTAEYAIIIIAAVALAGVLVAIMRSPEIRATLVDLVQNALGSAG